jgi:hypothetical protein
MFTIFSEEKEPLTESTKVNHELLMKVQNPALTSAIAQLCFQLSTEGVTFMVAANHLNARFLRLWITRWLFKSSLLLPPTVKAEAAGPGDVEAAGLVIAGMEDAVEGVVVATDAATELSTLNLNQRDPVITFLLIGTNDPMRNATRFARSATRRVNKAVQRELSRTSQLNMSQPLLALCSKHHPSRAPTNQLQHMR